MTTAKIRSLSYIRKDDKWDSSRQELSPQVTEGLNQASLKRVIPTTVWETSRSDKKGSIVKGAGCEQCEQTEGLTIAHFLFKFRITTKKSLRLALTRPTSILREARRQEK